MPRNAAGVYTLPDPPRVPNTVIDSPDENITRDDIASELTNSLDRNGRGGMLAPFRIADGTLAAPGLAFLNEPGTGLWRPAAGVMKIAVQGADIAQFNANGFSLSAGMGFTALGRIFLSDGTLAAPSLTFNAEQGSGIFREAAGIWCAVVNGAKVMNFASTPILQVTIPGGAKFEVFNDATVHGTLSAGRASPAWIQLSGGATNVTIGASMGIVHIPNGLAVTAGQIIAVDGLTATNYMHYLGGDTINFVTGSSSRFRISNTAGTFFNSVILQPLQQLFFDGGGDTWIQENAANSLRVIVGGGNAITFFNSGSAIAPGNFLYFDGGGNTYVVEAAPDDLRFFVGGANVFRLRPTLVEVLGPTDFTIAAGRVLYFDGGSNTYIQESSPDQLSIVTGGAPSLRMVGGGLSSMFGNWALQAGNVLFLDGGSNTYIREASADRIGFVTANVAWFFFNEGGAIKAGDGGFQSVGATYHEFCTVADNFCMWVQNKKAAPWTQAHIGVFNYTSGGPNNDTIFFIWCIDAGSKLQLRSNGGIANFQANNVNLSDAGMKDSIQVLAPLDAAKLWNAHRDVAWCSFKYIEQTHDDPNFGYLAQDIEAKFGDVMPWLVDDQNWGDVNKPVMRKVVYDADLKNVAHAVLSAAQRRIEVLEAELETLKARIH